MNKNEKTITADEFDRIFDEGKEDITQYLDLSSATRINAKSRRVNVDFPAWVVEAMDREADRIGITRQAYIKIVMAERLEKVAQQR